MRRALLNCLIFFVLLKNAHPDGYSDEHTFEEETTEGIEAQSDNDTATNQNHKSHPYGNPINILQFAPDFNLTVDLENLKKLFLNVEVQDRKAITISIIGAFRKGKSFILDYFLRYLYAKFRSVNNMSENRVNGSWMGKPSDPLMGFSWRSGSERDTSGIIFWSDAFLYDAPNGEKYAIYLIDTQGLFDTRTPMQENIKIFGLGTLISSLQIFNLNDVIQEDQLQYLQMATDYTKFAINENKAKNIKGIKSFQNLLFLMRDWNNVDEYEYGLEEGHRYLMDTLKLEDDQKPELREVRLYIQSSFEKIDCFLMPHPGLNAVTNKNWDGRFSELDMEFRNQLTSLVTWLFSPKNLKPKKVFSEELTSKKFFTYMRSYFDIFRGNTPEVESIYTATVNSHLKGLVDSYLTEFKNEISKNTDINATDYVRNLEKSYNDIKKVVLNKFNDVRKMGNKEQEKNFHKILNLKIGEFYRDFKKYAINNHKVYIETVAKAEEEKAKFEEQLDKLIQANRTQIAAGIKKLEHEFQEKENEYEQLKLNLETSKDELLQSIMNNHSLSLEEVEMSKKVIQEAFELKRQQFEIDEKNRLAHYEKDLLEKQKEIELRESALLEQTQKIQEQLNNHEEKIIKMWERQQALKIEQLQFEQTMEEKRSERERHRYEKQMQIDQQRFKFEQEMEETRVKNQEKLLVYQKQMEEIREKASKERRELDIEHMKQQQEFQLQILKLNAEKEKEIQQMKNSKISQDKGFFKHIFDSIIGIAMPIISVVV